MDYQVLEREIEKLRRENLALKTQSKLLKSFVTLVRSPSEASLLKKILQKTVDIAAELAGAEGGSLLLLDEKGTVADFFLTRKSGSAEDASKIIGTVLDKGLAGWVMQHRQVGLMKDTRTDDRWIDLPNQPYKARSVLVIPILKGNDLFGILTLMHSEPNNFDQETVKIITIAAGQLAIFLENAQLYTKLDSAYKSLAIAKEQIESYSKALDSELEKGQKIQRNFLPVQTPQIPNWSISARFHPAKQVSGDFYDMFMLPNNHIGLVIADVCDKGVSAALFMGLFRSLIRIFAEQTMRLEEADIARNDTAYIHHVQSRQLSQKALKAVPLTNAYIEKHHGKEGMFATMFFGVLNTDSGNLFYINAGHEPLLLIKGSKVIESIGPTGPAVGIMPNSQFRIEEIKLGYGDTLFGYTDGVTDASSSSYERFGRDRLITSISHAETSPIDLLDFIEKKIFDHIGQSDITDDIAMIVVHRLSR